MALLGHVNFTAAALLALVQAAVGLAVAFGAPLDHEQRQAIVDVVVALCAVLPIGGAVLAHANITAPPAAGPEDAGAESMRAAG